MSDDSNGKECDPVSVPTDLKEQATDGSPLANGRVLVKTPDLKFRKQGNKQLFAKGNKPPGRPTGSKNKMTALAAEMIGESAEKIIKKVIRKALDDNDRDQAMMLKLLIERIAPATKAVDIQSINREEKTITISVEGAIVHEGSLGEVLDAEIVDFIEEDDDK